ncbi:hypothetical protein AZ026_005383, partial [Klebsiella pneumoniae]
VTGDFFYAGSGVRNNGIKSRNDFISG